MTPSITSNSCIALSNNTWVIAAPGIAESSVRRRELPRVWPNPGSSGEIRNLCLFPDSSSWALISGRCIKSIFFYLTGILVDYLLAVELNY